MSIGVEIRDRCKELENIFHNIGPVLENAEGEKYRKYWMGQAQELINSLDTMGRILIYVVEGGKTP